MGDPHNYSVHLPVKHHMQKIALLCWGFYSLKIIEVGQKLGLVFVIRAYKIDFVLKAAVE